MGLHGGLIAIAFTEGEEIGLVRIAADFETQAARLLARRGSVFEDDGEEFVDLLWIDLKNDNDIDHAEATEAIFA